MSSSFLDDSRFVSFQFRGPGFRSVEVPAKLIASAVHGPVGEALADDRIVLASRAPVPPGLPLEMRFELGSGRSVVLMGITHRYLPDGEGAYTVEITVTPTHRERLAQLRVGARRPPPSTHTAPIVTPPPPPSMEPVSSRPAPTRSATSYSFTRASNRLPIRMRVQAPERLKGRIKESQRHDHGGTIQIPLATPAQPGSRVLLDVHFGNSTDDIVLAGVVKTFTDSWDGNKDAVIRMVPSHRHRVGYLAEVIRGQRNPTERSQRRYEVRYEARILRNSRIVPAAVESISRGGVFVRSHVAADEGKSVDLELLLPGEGRVCLTGDVRWTSKQDNRVGFGASFAEGQRHLLERVQRVLDGLAPGFKPPVAWA
jgi:hypothetical protein